VIGSRYLQNLGETRNRRRMGQISKRRPSRPHVDELGSNSKPSDAAAGHRQHEVSLVQADGRTDLDTGANPGDATDLFGTTAGYQTTECPSSRWFDGTDSNLKLADVSLAASRFEFKVL
jgi:hypothetical protein